MPKKSAYDFDKAKELYEDGMTDLEISREIGCSPGRVSQWRSLLGLPSQTKRKAMENNGTSTLEMAAREATRLGISYGTYMSMKRVPT